MEGENGGLRKGIDGACRRRLPLEGADRDLRGEAELLGQWRAAQSFAGATSFPNNSYKVHEQGARGGPQGPEYIDRCAHIGLRANQ
eukprot:16438234-Heterocapsa_arctica.AAC.1